MLEHDPVYTVTSEDERHGQKLLTVTLMFDQPGGTKIAPADALTFLMDSQILRKISQVAAGQLNLGPGAVMPRGAAVPLLADPAKRSTLNGYRRAFVFKSPT